MGRLDRIVRMASIAFTASVPIVAWAIDVGVALTASHLIAFLLIALAAAVWGTTRRPLPIDLATLSVACFLAVAAVTVVRVLLDPDVVILGESMHRKSVKQLAGLGFAFALFVAFRYLLQAFRLASTIARAHFWTTAVIATLTILQFGAAWWNIESAWANFPVDNSTLGETRGLGTGVILYGFPRVSLTFVEPSRLGIYLLTGWAFWLYTERPFTDTSLHRVLPVLAGILVGVAALVTGSRVAHVVFILGAVSAIALRPYRFYRAALVTATIVVAAGITNPWKAVGVTATLIPEDVPVATQPRISETERASIANAPGRLQRVQPSPYDLRETDKASVANTLGPLQRLEVGLIDMGVRSNVSAKHRIGSLVVALSVVQDYPWLGIGYGTSEFAMAVRYPDEMGAIVAEGRYRPTMLGILAVVLTETGVVGTLCLLGLLVGVALTLGKILRSGDSQARRSAGGLSAAIAVYLLAMSVQTVEVYQFLLAWVLLPVALSLRAEDSGR